MGISCSPLVAALAGLTLSQSFRATVENVPVRLLPTVLNTVTAATEISAAIKAYSIEVAAVSLLRRLDSLASMAVARLSR